MLNNSAGDSGGFPHETSPGSNPLPISVSSRLLRSSVIGHRSSDIPPCVSASQNGCFPPSPSMSSTFHCTDVVLHQINSKKSGNMYYIYSYQNRLVFLLIYYSLMLNNGSHGRQEHHRRGFNQN